MYPDHTDSKITRGCAMKFGRNISTPHQGCNRHVEIMIVNRKFYFNIYLTNKWLSSIITLLELFTLLFDLPLWHGKLQREGREGQFPYPSSLESTGIKTDC